MPSMNSNYRLFKATFRPNYPVCEGYILFYAKTGLNVEVDFDARLKAVAIGLGFSYPEPMEIKLLGKIQPTRNDHPDGVLSYATGEY